MQQVRTGASRRIARAEADGERRLKIFFIVRRYIDKGPGDMGCSRECRRCSAHEPVSRKTFFRGICSSKALPRAGHRLHSTSLILQDCAVCRRRSRVRRQRCSRSESRGNRLLPSLSASSGRLFRLALSSGGECMPRLSAARAVHNGVDKDEGRAHNRPP